MQRNKPCRNATQAFSVAAEKLRNTTQCKSNASMCWDMPWWNNYYYVSAVGCSDWLSSLRQSCSKGKI